MARAQMRPSFRVQVASSADHLQETIAANLDRARGDVEGKLSARHGVLRIPQKKQRFWTPCLDFTIEEQEPTIETGASAPDSAQSQVWGTFSPRAEIWTAFVFTIGTLVIVSIFAGVYGIAQLALGHPALGLLVPVGAAILAALLYVAALVGQGLSISDMYRLRAFVDDCLREAETQASRSPTAARDSAQL